MENKQAMMQALMGGPGMQPSPVAQQQAAMPTPEQIEQAMMVLQQAGMLGPNGMPAQK